MYVISKMEEVNRKFQGHILEENAGADGEKHFLYKERRIL
jgi:hypothetical protein